MNPGSRLPRPKLIAATLALAVVAAIAALAVASGGGDDELVVYNGRSHYGGEQAFKAFERQTGTKVRLFAGDAEELFQRLRNEGEDSPADVLVTVDGANLWRAKQAGLLAPTRSAAIERAIPGALRDPEGEWTGIATRVRTVMRSTERVKPGAIDELSDLGDRRWRGRLCLRTSNNIYNQSLVADQIAKRGRAATERMLRSWMANDPEVLGSDVDVLKAIAAGRCDVGLTNHYYLGRLLKDDPQFPVAPVWTGQDGAGAHTNLSGAAVVRGTDQPEQARALVEFLTTPGAQRSLAANSEFPANPKVQPAEHIRDWTGVRHDAIDVARAGARQADAVALMSEVGWE